jgi:amidohydrolase
VARQRIESIAPDLLELSHSIHSEPEIAYEELLSVGKLTAFLRGHGISATSSPYSLSTAFEARFGEGPTVVAICAEYDALPGIGHACGHNIIAASAVGAAFGLHAVADAAGLSIQLLGTPAEEAGNDSGKIRLLEAGAFASATAAIMVHPAPLDVVRPMMIAAARFDIEYRGKESHAAFFPELGINAGDAMTVAQVGIGLLRQHIVATDRIHGIVTFGGEAPNIVPARTSAQYMARSANILQLGHLRERVLECFRAGSVATGAELAIAGGDKPYAQVDHNLPLSELYASVAMRLGRTFHHGERIDRPSGSTDMGNVSLSIPSIHPFIGIGSWPAVNHQPEFEAHCVTVEADKAVVDGAVAMAWTAIQLGRKPDPVAFLAGR